jgi:opacity protein-like surface antigen
MKNLLLAVSAALISTAAFAADLPVKTSVAAPVPYCTPGNCSGLYGGFGFAGTGANLDLLNGGSVFSAGGTVKVQGGYQLWNGNWLAAIDLSFGGEFTTATNSAVPVVPREKGRSKLFGSEMIKLGYNFFPSSQSVAPAPSQSPIAFLTPANLLAASTPYVKCGGLQRRGISAGACGAGVEAVIASGWTADFSYLNSPAQQGLPADQLVMIEINKHFNFGN